MSYIHLPEKVSKARQREAENARKNRAEIVRAYSQGNVSSGKTSFLQRTAHRPSGGQQQSNISPWKLPSRASIITARVTHSPNHHQHSQPKESKCQL